MNWILALVAKLLFNERGQVAMETPEGGGGEGDQGGGDPTPSPEPQTEQPAQGEPAPTPEESFIDPASLPEELKPHWKRMHGQYTKFAQERKALREAQATIERFNSDPDFAFQAMQQRAAMMGYQIIRPGQNGTQQAPITPIQGNGEIPQQFLQATQANLPQELQWLAPPIAHANYAAVKAHLEPLQRQAQQERLAQRDQLFDEQEAKLTEKHPGWEQYEDQMDGLLKWLKSDSLSHPLYGSKLEILYKLATDQAASVSEAAKRLNAAARNRTTTGHVTSNASPNIFKRVREAKTTNDAWDVAAKFAIDQVKAGGGQV